MLNEKKFSTAALTVLMGMWGLMPTGQGGRAYAQDAGSATPPAPARHARQQPAGNVFVADAPDQHVVVKGDTLWGIAGKYLQTPWRWPEVWQMNRDQIRNPHWIYPGQIIILDKVHGTMRLGSGGPGPTVVLEPSIRIERGRDAIPSIPPGEIEPFLSRPLVVQDENLKDAPRIIAAKGDRVDLARGDTAYIAGITDPSIRTYQVFRPGIALKDPDTGAVLGYQANYLGVAEITRNGDPATAVISSFAEEINVGDRLVEASKPSLINYAPHAPETPVQGKIINTYSGLGLAGRDMIVVLNRGTLDGLDIGTILAVRTQGETIIDKTEGGNETIKLPDERSGVMFVFRLFDHISYALVLNSMQGVEAGDSFGPP